MPQNVKKSQNHCTLIHILYLEIKQYTYIYRLMRKNFSYIVMKRFLAGKGLGSAKRMIDSGGGPEREGEREGEILEKWPGQKW